MPIVQKSVLFAGGVILLAWQPSGALSVAAFLVALAIGSFHTYFEDKPLFLSVSGTAYLALCLWDVRFGLFIPLLMYELFRSRKWTLCALCVGAAAYTLREQYFILFSVLTLCAVSFLFQHQTSENAELEASLKTTRDNSAELTTELKNKNRHLMEKQDYEIYLATLKERNRIAREMHDNVGHMLSRSILQTGAMMAVNSDPEFGEQLLGLKDTLSGAMDSVRQSVHDLHDESVDLHGSIKTIADSMPDYAIRLDYDMGEHVGANIKYCFLAVIKEALSNTAKHSDARNIHIIAREHPGFYQLLIEDDGTRRTTGPTPGGMGLLNMQQRVDALGGTFRATDDSGFTIFVSIPKATNNEEGST